MGAHFSSPFAIIFMHKVEEQALEKLIFYGIKPDLYARYIDDIIIGPFHRENDSVQEKILDVFNSINDNVKFTMEVPAKEEGLNYLDISITINDSRVEYEWYQKDCHSGICLREDSHIPQHVKRNFITNTVNRIKNRCSNNDTKKIKIKKFMNSLKNNGYEETQVMSVGMSWHVYIFL